MSANNNNSPPPFRLVLLGEGNVGKTSLVQALYSTEDQKRIFSHPGALNSTIGVDFFVHTMPMPEAPAGAKMAQLQIWDTAGQEIYHSMTKNYYRRAECAILVFELFNLESWKMVEAWFHEVRAFNPDMGIVLVGNKVDLIPKLTPVQTRDWAIVWDLAHDFAHKHSVRLVTHSNVSPPGEGGGADEVMEAALLECIECRRKVAVEVEAQAEAEAALAASEAAAAAAVDRRRRREEREPLLPPVRLSLTRRLRQSFEQHRQKTAAAAGAAVVRLDAAAAEEDDEDEDRCCQ